MCYVYHLFPNWFSPHDTFLVVFCVHEGTLPYLHMRHGNLALKI